MSIVSALAVVMALLASTLLFAPAANANPAPNQYVALGDSYASGMGADVYKSPYAVNVGNADLGSYEEGTAIPDTGCWRNTHAYPNQIAAHTGYNLAFRACAGATIWEVIHGKSGETSQLDSLSPETEIVTITAGGIDAEFMGVMECIITSYCRPDSPAIQHSSHMIANELPANYDWLLNEVKAKAPNARIAMFGYATTVPEPLNTQIYMQPSEQSLAMNLRNNVNQAMANAAARHGVQYVDPFAAGSPFNRADASADVLWNSSATWALRVEVAGIGSSWHPTRKGHDYAAQVITSALNL